MSNLVTGKVRFSYCNVFEPRTIEGQDPRYSVTLLIPKSDTETIQKISAAIAEATKEGNDKVFGTTIVKPKTPIYDGDGTRPSGELFGEECKGCHVMDGYHRVCHEEHQCYTGQYEGISQSGCQ